MTIERSALTTEQTRAVFGRHHARQVRARIVTLAQQYREACRQHEAVMVAVMTEPALPTETMMDAERRLFDLLQEARAALFAALDELERLEEEGPS